MTTTLHFLRRLGAAALLLVPAIAACGGKGGPAAAAGAEAIRLGRENVTIAEVRALRSGPTVSGALTAERQATIRAETGGTVLQLYAEQGQAVARDQKLAKLDDNVIRDAYESARSTVRTAELAVELAKRNQQRNQALYDAGAISSRDLEQAGLMLTSTEGQYADAQARLASAERQLKRTEVHSPLGGVVSERRINVGDDVTPGTPLFTVVDLGSLRFEAAVPSEQLQVIHVGMPVEFTVDGFPGRVSTGQIARINPAVDPSTRQVRISITVPNETGRLATGLFASGRIAAQSQNGVAVPVTAVDERGVAPVVYKVTGGKVQKATVELGVRDDLAEQVEIKSGVAAGDTLLMGSAQGISEGSLVQVVGE
jgi:RND family efflux transporter MFP subunit